MDSSWNHTGARETDQSNKVGTLVIRVIMITDSNQVPVDTLS
jgi:hypothetical protein